MYNRVVHFFLLFCSCTERFWEEMRVNRSKDVSTTSNIILKINWESLQKQKSEFVFSHLPHRFLRACKLAIRWTSLLLWLLVSHRRRRLRKKVRHPTIYYIDTYAILQWRTSKIMQGEIFMVGRMSAFNSFYFLPVVYSERLVYFKFYL